MIIQIQYTYFTALLVNNNFLRLQQNLHDIKMTPVCCNYQSRHLAIDLDNAYIIYVAAEIMQQNDQYIYIGNMGNRNRKTNILLSPPYSLHIADPLQLLAEEGEKQFSCYHHAQLPKFYVFDYAYMTTSQMKNFMYITVY